MSGALLTGNSANLAPRQRAAGSPHDASLSADAIIDEFHDPRLARSAIRLAALGLIAFFVWAALTPVHEVTVGSGEVLPTGLVQNIQHLEGGIVADVMVSEGEAIKKDQVILRLDDLAVRAELAKAEARAEGTRLEIERQKSGSAAFSGVFEGEMKLRGIIDSQRQATLAEDAHRAAQLDVIRAEIATKHAEITNLGEQAAKTGEELQIVAAQLDDLNQAVQNGTVTRHQRDAVARDKVQLEAALLQINGQSATIRSGLSEAEARLREMSTGFAQVAGAAIADLQLQQSDALELVGQLTDRLNRTIVRSPVDGIVQRLFVQSPGQIVAPGAPVAEIVPAGEKLFAEVRVPADQIGYVSVGMNAKVKILTYDYTRFGGIDGTVEDISPSSLQREDGSAPYYRVRIAMQSQYVGAPESGRRIGSGLSVSADILSGQKTILSYLLKPLRAISDRALTEK